MTVVAKPNVHRPGRRALVTGGCGFLGCNLAAALAARGHDVLVLDNFSRHGSYENARWLKEGYGHRVEIMRADVRGGRALRTAVERATCVFHLAAQVAVTTSLEHPLEDLDINAFGTLNLLEVVRRSNPTAPVLFASTNKVYGKLLDDTAVVQNGERYVPQGDRFAAGVAEDTPLDLYSPYGCSKGAADQYVRDYARVFGLKTAVMRMSCIYGPRQFGTEDQGWIAHFLIQALQRRPLTIYGDGCQVRDALYVVDAVEAWLSTLERIDAVSGTVFNLGGGLDNSISLRELLGIIGNLHGEPPDVRFAQWRPGDQPWYVSDIRRISAALEWSPRTPLRQGLRVLDSWLRSRGDHAESSGLREALA